jgi:hypothetical protein
LIKSIIRDEEKHIKILKKVKKIKIKWKEVENEKLFAYRK